MLRGEKVGLREQRADDIPVLMALYNDPELGMVASGDAWRPRAVEDVQARFAATLNSPPPDRVGFSVEDLATGELAGNASLWGIDAHNRTAHLGFTLLPGFRGRGLGKDVVRTLCDYGFRVRSLHRLQVDTLASNAAARGASSANGFVLEGQMRRSAWVAGEFVDEVVLGLLADEWRSRRQVTGDPVDRPA